MGSRSRQILAYVAAPLLVAVALLVRYLLIGDLTEPEPDILMTAVALSGFLGGLGPALLATTTGLLVEAYFHAEPIGSFFVASHRDRVELGVFVAGGIAIGVIFEVLRRVRRQEASVRRTLAMITRCNEAILRATTEEGLYADICKVIVDEGGYRMCWAGRAEDDARKTVRPVCHAGHEDGFLAGVDIVWADVPRGRGPTGTAAREARIVVGRDLAHDPELDPWREEALRRGYRSASSIPILHDGQVLAVIVMYSGDVTVFSPGELRLLKQLSDDVAFGVNALRERTARALQETQLREARARLAYVLEGSSDGFWDWDISSGRVDFSTSTASMLGYDVNELAPDPSTWSRLIHPDDAERVRSALDAHLRGESGQFVVEHRARHRDGRWVWILDRGKVVERDADGKPTRMAGAYTDVTERRHTERALRESEARHRLLADNAMDVVWTMSLDGKITYLSPAVEKLRGFSVAEAMAQSLEEIHPLPSAAVSAGYFQKLFADVGAGRAPQRFRGELEYKCRDGSTVWCDVIVLPVVGPDGAVRELLGVSRDLSDRKQAEEALRRSEALLRTVTESSPDAIVAKDRNGRWTFANHAALRNLRRSAQEILGRTDVEVLGNSPVPREWMAHDRKVMESGVPQSFEEKLSDPDGLRSFLSSKAPLRDAEGSVAGIVVISKDVTEQRLMEQRLAVASRLAAMGTLVAGVAHEINNPMTGIMAGLGVATGDVRSQLASLERGEAPSREALVAHDEEVLEVLADASEAASRIARIVQDLAVFGAPNQQRARLRVADLVAGAMRWVPAHVHGAASVSVEDLGAPDVMASRGQLEQVVVNLVTNAARATRPGGKGSVVVRIGTAPEGRTFLEVEDDGTGIDPANVSRVFDPFFTTRPAGEGRGTGLGLAICHAIVADHGGAITVETELGTGSTFRVELPAAPDQPVTTTA